MKTQIEWPSNAFIGEKSSENTNEINEFIACNASENADWMTQ